MMENGNASDGSGDERPHHQRPRAPSPGLPERPHAPPPAHDSSPGLPSQNPRPTHKHKKKNKYRRRTAPALLDVSQSHGMITEPSSISLGQNTSNSEDSPVLTSLEQKVSDEFATHKARRWMNRLNPGAFSVTGGSDGKNETKRASTVWSSRGAYRIHKTENHNPQGRRMSGATTSPFLLEEKVGDTQNISEPDDSLADSERSSSPDRCRSHRARRNLTPRTSNSSFSVTDLEANERLPLEPPFNDEDDSEYPGPTPQPLDASVYNFEDWLARHRQEEIIGRQQKRRRMRLCCAAVVVVVVLVLFVLGIIFVTRKPETNAVDGKEEPVSTGALDMNECVEADASHKIFSSRYKSIRQQLRSKSSGIVSLMDKPNTPQRMALCWLADYDDIDPPIQDPDPSAFLQRYTMAVFYYTIMDETIPAGLGISNWVTSDHECLWRGASCTLQNKNEVTRIILTNEYLHGSLPYEIGDLSNLELLMVSKNKLGGSLPSSLWDLTNLNVISAESNILTGSLPSTIGNLSNLRVLSLSDNNISGSLPEEIGRLTDLLEFFGSGNFFGGTIPTSIGLVTELNQFVLAPCRLEGPLPSEIGLLKDLETLDLNRNSLSSSIPTEIGGLKNLLIFDLSDNGLSGTIPEEIGRLSYLSEFRTQGNFLEGQIPTTFAKLENLDHLVLNFNGLTGKIPSELGTLRLLGTLGLSGLSLTGTIPTEIGLLVNLVTLVISDSGLTGTIPTTLGNLESAEQIVLVDNELVGAVAPEICALRQGYLQTLEVDCAGDVPDVTCPESCCTVCE